MIPPGPPPAPPPPPEAGRRHGGAAGDLPTGLGGRQQQGGGAQGQGDLSARADRFAAALAGGVARTAPVPGLAAAPPVALTPPAGPEGEGEGDGGASAFAGGAAVTAPPPPPAQVAEPAPLLPAGTATAEAVADITRRVTAELRAAEAPSGPLANRGTVTLALDLGRTALGITGLRLEIGPQTLVLVLTVPPGGAVHDLPQAIQALAQALTARHPHRTVRIQTEGTTPPEPESSGPAGFDPFRPWARGGA